MGTIPGELGLQTAWLRRLSGVSLAAGGSLATAAWVFVALVDPGRTGYAEAWWAPVHLAIMFGGLFMALGLPGLYAAQAARTGAPGLVGLLLFFVGMLVAYVAVHPLETMTRPSVPPGMRTLAAIGGPALFLGGVITGITMIRARVYPTGAGVALMAAILLGLLTRLVPMPGSLLHLIPAVFTATMAWIGVLVARPRSSLPMRGGVP